MSNYYGYVSIDALMDFAHNHVNGMIDSNDIARFPIANVKDANEQQSLQQIFGVPFARLRELASAEREELIYILPDCKTCANKEDNRTCGVCVSKTINYQNSFYEPLAAADAGKGN